MAEENEKKDSSAVGKINSFAGKGRNLQRAYSVYKKARVAMVAGEGLGALAGPAVGVGIATLILVVVVIIFSGAAPSTVAGGDLSSPPPSDSGATTPPGGPVDTTNVVARLKSDFNITVAGDRVTEQRLISIYNYLSAFSPYPNYVSRIKSASPTLTLSSQQPGKPWAFTYSSGDVILYRDFWGGEAYTQKKYLIHEFGHVVGNTNGSQLQDNLYKQVSKAGRDKLCFDSFGIIKTYSLSSGSSRPVHETFAESLADTMVCGSGTCGGSGKGGGDIIQNFPAYCSDTYTYIMTYVLR